VIEYYGDRMSMGRAAMEGGQNAVILRTIADERRTRVRNIEDYDPNACQFTIDAAHEWRPVATEGHPFWQEIRFSLDGRRVTISANQGWFRLKVEGKLKVGVCSINKSNQIEMMEKTELRVAADPRWDIFVPARTRPSIDLRSFLKLPRLHDAVVQLLGTDPSSGLHIFAGALLLYARAHSAQELSDKIEILSRLVGTYRPLIRLSDLISLPERFHHLIPLIVKWAEPDDLKRAALLDESSNSSLSELVQALAPEFDEIDWYLSSFDDTAWPEAATALGRVAECAVEARPKLSRVGQ